jgi:peptide/nickel transport system substrate-binding protein
MKRSTAWLIAALVLGLPYLSQGQESKPKYGGTLSFGIERDISTLNPFVLMRSTDLYVRSLIYESLLDEDLKGNIIAGLAESWNVSKDGLRYTFKLRRGVKFHNGQEVTAEDVKWCADYAMEPKNGSEGFIYLRGVNAVRAVDRTTVEFTLKQPRAVFLSYMATLRPFPVVPKGSVPAASDKIDNFPPGTGPFRFKEWKRLAQVVFTRNNDYWQRGVPYLDQVIVKIAEDPTVRFTALRAGDLDMIERTPHAFVQKVDSGEVRNIKSTAARFGGFRRIVFNVADAPFNNRKLREAVSYALDRKQFIQAAFWGYGTPVQQRIPAGNPWHVKLPERERDLAKVKALLKEAGVGDDFAMEILGRKGVEAEQQILQQQLQSAGIKVKLLVLEGAAYRQQQRRGEFQAVLFGGDLPSDPADAYGPEYACDEESVQAKKRAMNMAGYCNKDLDRLLAQADSVTDQKKRRELYSRAIKIIHDEVPDLPLAYVPRFFTYHEKFKGFLTDADGRFNGTTFGLSRIWMER